MNNNASFNTLLALSLAAVILMVFFNLILRRSSFAVTIGYSLPQVEPPAPEMPAEESAAQRTYPEPEPADSLEAEQGGDEDYQPESAPQPEPQPQPESSGELTSVQFPLELNRATQEQLMFIPRVGTVTSQRIIQYREYLGGRYSSLEQLLEISGIGEATFLHITAYLYLEEETVETQPEPESDGEGSGDEYNWDYHESDGGNIWYEE